MHGKRKRIKIYGQHSRESSQSHLHPRQRHRSRSSEISSGLDHRNTNYRVDSNDGLSLNTSTNTSGSRRRPTQMMVLWMTTTIAGPIPGLLVRPLRPPRQGCRRRRLHAYVALDHAVRILPHVFTVS